VGTGTGTLARGFARRGCRVIGIDPALEMLTEARHLDEQIGVKVLYLAARAENTSLSSESADLVIAGQCWHWFDRPAAANESARLLKPEGKIVVAHFDWIPLAGNLVEATEKLILRHNPAWKLVGGNGIYPQWLKDLGEAGYRQIETFSYDLPEPYSHVDWRGHIRASAGVGASLSPEQVMIFDAELAVLLSERFPEPIVQVPHRVYAVIAQPPLG
jgi:SAM-dependent methyltransferase